MSADRLLDTVSATNITHKRNNKTCELIIDSNCTINNLQEMDSLVYTPSISIDYDSAATNIVQLFTSDNISNYKINLLPVPLKYISSKYTKNVLCIYNHKDGLYKVGKLYSKFLNCYYNLERINAYFEQLATKARQFKFVDTQVTNDIILTIYFEKRHLYLTINVDNEEFINIPRHSINRIRQLVTYYIDNELLELGLMFIVNKNNEETDTNFKYTISETEFEHHFIDLKKEVNDISRANTVVKNKTIPIMVNKQQKKVLCFTRFIPEYASIYINYTYSNLYRTYNNDKLNLEPEHQLFIFLRVICLEKYKLEKIVFEFADTIKYIAETYNKLNIMNNSDLTDNSENYDLYKTAKQEIEALSLNLLGTICNYIKPLIDDEYLRAIGEDVSTDINNSAIEIHNELQSIINESKIRNDFVKYLNK